MEDWKADWEIELENLTKAWVKDIAKRHNVPEEDIYRKLAELSKIEVEQIIANNHYENSTVINKAEKVHVGEIKRVQIIRDESIYADTSTQRAIKNMVEELVDLIKLALYCGIPKSGLKLDFRITQNPYPTIYSELQKRCRYSKLELLPKENVKCVYRYLNGWIDSVAGVLYKNGVPPYNRNKMIKKFYFACNKAGVDPKAEALKRWGTDNFGEIELLELFKAYRSLKSKMKKSK
ncbi:hypothetical protein SAMN06269117_12520 [Balnearium lithotrophicum]|uniref:Uncharacterized protein n=1 Tax=Balnearium lithotrophicum TaxID=223788 RepID=A0A521DT08_9BACT|nr:hypothetical protein [Balnearium lithotrophicum]SMO74834.1 hypothetical protein SAMN06269117_12520 [Balnearium lithotrophicum]